MHRAVSLAFVGFALVGCRESSSSGVHASTTTDGIVKPAIQTPKVAPDEGVLASLGVDRERIARSPVPVLAARGLESPVVMIESEYYAISAHAGTASIAIQGTRTAHRYEGVAPVEGNRALRGGRGFVTLNEGIRSASFMENGVAYSVDVECATAGDPKCTSDAFVVNLVDSLVYVGGGAR